MPVQAEHARPIARVEGVRRRVNRGGGRLTQNAYLTPLLFQGDSAHVQDLMQIAVDSRQRLLSRERVEVLNNTESNRVDHWYRKFVGSIDPMWTEYGLTQTQRPTIRRLITSIVSNTPHPGEIINPIIGEEEYAGVREGIFLWEGLDKLMSATEQLTGESHRYTPYEFIGSLRGFSDACVVSYLQADEKRKAGHTIELGLLPDTKARLIRSIDQAVEDPELMERQLRKAGPEFAVYPSSDGGYMWRTDWREYREKHINEQKAYLTDPSRTAEDWMRINGIMRASPTCGLQTDFLLDRLPGFEPDLGFLSANASILPFMFGERHEFILAVPSSEVKDSILAIQKDIAKDSDPFLAATEDPRPGIPSVASMTVIDPSILQLFDLPFLNDLAPEERIPFSRSIAPGSFSDNGVFVDTYLNYVEFLGLLSSFNSEAYVHSESYFKRNAVPMSL